MQLSGLSSPAAAFVLAVAAPLVLGLLRHPDLRFLPPIALSRQSPGWASSGGAACLQRHLRRLCPECSPAPGRPSTPCTPRPRATTRRARPWAGLDFLTWDLALDSARASFARRLARRHQDPRVKVILVTFRSPFDV